MFRRFGMAAVAALMLGAGAASAPTPANAAHVYVSLGVHYAPPPGYRLCRHYRYYGLPPHSCYLTYTGPVYYGGHWYRGPVHYRWLSGRPMFWIHGGWRDWDGWRHHDWHEWHDRDWHRDRH